MKLHLIRHTSLNIPSGICYGQSDVDVSDNFHSEQSLLREKLAHVKFDLVYASLFQRGDI